MISIRFSRLSCLLMFLCCVGLLLRTTSACASSPREELEKSRQTLETIQQRIQQTVKDLDRKKSDESSLRADLETVEQELRKIDQRKAGLSSRLNQLEKEIAEKEDHIRQTKTSIDRLQDQVEKRLVALYKGADAGFIRILFAGIPPAKIAEEYDFLGRIVQKDRQLLNDYRTNLANLEKATVQLRNLHDEQKEAMATLRGEEANFAQARKLKTRLLSQVRSDQETLARQLGELEEKAERLSDLVKKLESEKPHEYSQKSGLFAAQKGRLPWPATGIIRTGFGLGRHPELGTAYDSHGLEISVGVDKPVSAVAAGKVIFASWFKGYGNLLILDHGDSFYTLYAQTSRLLKKVGDKVSAGEQVAFSGYEGNENLYFEVREGRTPLDPTKWLVPR
ncbi:peptidase M23 [Desulfuromonas sp. AOP6]|nr:peptidase M23 [Desulfuromonas sp. AOP6]